MHDASIWIGIGGLAITLFLAIAAGAVAFGKLAANVKSLTEIVNNLARESRIDGRSMAELRQLVSTLKETVAEMHQTYRESFSERLSLVERKLDLIEDQHKRNHPE